MSDNLQSTSGGTRSQLRFSLFLRLGGLAVVILCGLVAWLPWHRQIQTIGEIRRLDGYVGVSPFGPDSLRSIAGNRVMAGYDHVTFVSLRGTQVTDAELVRLNQLTELQSLELLGTRATDAGLVHLKSLTNLQTLSLEGTKVTDTGLVHLKGLTSLRHLNLMNTQVTDTGLMDLQTALPKCEIRTR